MTTNLKSTIGGLITNPNDYNPTISTKRTARIKTSRLATLPINPFDTGKRQPTILNPDYLPDLIARRAQAVYSDPSAQSMCKIDFSKAVKCKGIIFPAITPDMVKAGNHPVDVLGRSDMSHIKHEMPNCINLTQDDVNFIATWAILHVEHKKKTHQKVTWPKLGTWPNWPDTIDVDGNPFPCCLPERKEELLATPTITAPTVTVETPPNVAQQRLANFKFTI